MTRLLAAFVLMFFSVGLMAASLLSDDQTLPFHQVSSEPLSVADKVNDTAALVIKGENNDIENRIVILRLDDKHATGYHTRLNIERPVRPGPFELHLPLAGLKTPNKRLFDFASWNKFYLFADKHDAKITVSAVEIQDSSPFSSASFGFDLGASDSPVMTGMTKVTTDYPGISGKYLRARYTASGNALTIDGVEGIEQLHLPLPNGTWRVRLWHRMPGEWENLPRQMMRKILVQGKTALARELSPSQWLAQDYFNGKDSEAVLDGDLWQLHGKRSFEWVETQATVTDGYLHIAMQGATTHDNYLAGVFATPVGLQGADTVKFDNTLRKRFEQKWPLSNTVSNTVSKTDANKNDVNIRRVEFQPSWRPDLARKTANDSVVLTRDGHAVVDFELTAGQAQSVSVELTFATSKGQRVDLPVELRQGFWRYQRPQGSATLLSLDADELRSVNSNQNLRLHPKLSRRVNLLVKDLGQLSAQKLRGRLTLSQDGQMLAQSEFDLVLTDFTLPPLSQSVGIYHEKPVHWGWFENLKVNADMTLLCDYRLLSGLGLTALSPPLTTPVDSLQPYLRDLRHYHNYFAQAAMDYTTIKRAKQRFGADAGALMNHLGLLNQTLINEGLPLPRFAMVDEMLELNKKQLAEFSQSVALIRAAMPQAQIIGQLNKPQNRQLLPMLDLIYINHGFGVEKSQIRQWQSRGMSVSLYNMPNPRLAAGFYLWRSGVQGYLQWHGRMPTAEPYFPLDGREADFQLLYPSTEVCPSVVDINSVLLALAEGISDRRWLSWLQRRAGVDNQAAKLLADIRRRTPADWQQANKLLVTQWFVWRQAIMDLALQSAVTKEVSYVKP